MTETPFDPKKALREEIAGLLDIRGTLLARERQAATKLGEAEAEHGTLSKLRGFADAELARKRAVLQALEVADSAG